MRKVIFMLVVTLAGIFAAFATDKNLTLDPNAEPREEIVALLNQIPRESLVYDNTDEEGRFDRFFKEGDSTLLYVHVGHGSGDTAVILFKGGKAEDVNDFISRINRELSELNSEE